MADKKVWFITGAGRGMSLFARSCVTHLYDLQDSTTIFDNRYTTCAPGLLQSTPDRVNQSRSLEAIRTFIQEEIRLWEGAGPASADDRTRRKGIGETS
jgi:hypothetical protein